MAWIESHQDLGSNPKTKRAARLLGVSRPTVVGHLHFLWWWALDHAFDGDVTAFDAMDLADAAEWEGDPDLFVTALVECGPGDKAGFLVQVDGRLELNDWMEFTAAMRTSREASLKANHTRHHVNKGVVEPSCRLCQPAPDLRSDSGRTPVGVRAEADRTLMLLRSDSTDLPTNQPTEPTDPPTDQSTPDGVTDDAELDATFEQFWEAYPRGRAGKPGGDGAKKPARRRWGRMTADQRASALVAVEHYRAHIDAPDGPFAAHAVTWLNQDRWEQWQEPATPRAGPPGASTYVDLHQTGSF